MYDKLRAPEPCPLKSVPPQPHSSPETECLRTLRDPRDSSPSLGHRRSRHLARALESHSPLPPSALLPSTFPGPCGLPVEALEDRGQLLWLSGRHLCGGVQRAGHTLGPQTASLETFTQPRAVPSVGRPTLPRKQHSYSE